MKHHDRRIREKFYEWSFNPTPAEKELQGLAFDFEEKHFQDLRLVTSSIRQRLLRHEALWEGKWVQTEDDPPDVSIDEWIFRYRRSRKGWIGLCDNKHRTIFIHPDLDDIQHRATLLHEMIHSYENQLPQQFREWLLLDLHRRMSKRIGPRRLQRYIDVSTHTVVHESAHAILFLLKSLDLDRRFKWPLGTVFGYGREDYFEGKKGGAK